MTRIKLDWNLTTSQQRADFVADYLSSPEFTTTPPTTSELDTISAYILWPQNKDNSMAQPYELERRNATWASTSQNKVESLDALFTSPSFSETTV